MSDETIVPFRVVDLDVLRKKDGDRHYCQSQCKKITIDPHERIIECQDCGKVIDPFDYLLSKAYAGEALMTGLKRLEDEARLKRNEIAILERGYQSIRGKLKRADAKVFEEAKSEISRVRWGAPFSIVTAATQ